MAYNICRIGVLILVLCTVAFVQGDEASKLKKVMDDFWEWKLETYPTFATGQGVHKYDDKLTSYNYTVFPARRNKVEGFLLEAKRIKRADLPTKGDIINYEVLMNDLQTYVDGSKWESYGNLNPITFLEGIHRSPGFWVGAMFVNVTNWQKTYDNYFKRLEAVPVMIDEHIECMTRSIRLNTTNNYWSMKDVPGQMEGIFVETEKTRYWWPMNETLINSTIPDIKKAEFRNRSRTIIETIILPKWRDLLLFINNTYMKNLRPNIGVSSLKDGQEYYAACLKWHLTVNMTADEVHDTGLREVERIKGDMQKVMDQVGYNGTLQEFFAHLKSRKEFYNHTEEELLQGYRDIIEKMINPKLYLVIKNETIPNVPVSVKRMQYNGPSGSYGSNTFWANTRSPETRPNYTMVALALHEANPGHHMQITIERFLDMAKFRTGGRQGWYSVPFNFQSYSIFVEGWGLYSEYLGQEGELDVYPTPYDLFGRYSSEMLRACRLVVDTGMHAKGWSRQRAVDYVGNLTAVPRMQIETEINRYITWPGQATAYKIGELAIKRLRNESVTALGDALFDKREFHDRILRSGRVPLKMVEEVIADYIEEMRSGTPEPSTPSTKKPSNESRKLVALPWITIITLLSVVTRHF